MLKEQVNVAVKAKPMEVKKTQTVASAKPYESPTVTTSGIADFLGDVKAEFKKINWTSPEELKTYTKIVVNATLFLGLGIYCVDLLIQLFLNGLNNIAHWIS